MKMISYLAVIMMLAGCATKHNPLNLPGCGSFNTNTLRNDIASPFRTDREWYETIILQLAWQLDCERSLMGCYAPSCSEVVE
jgi:hypothetical protein